MSHTRKKRQNSTTTFAVWSATWERLQRPTVDGAPLRTLLEKSKRDAVGSGACRSECGHKKTKLKISSASFFPRTRQNDTRKNDGHTNRTQKRRNTDGCCSREGPNRSPKNLTRKQEEAQMFIPLIDHHHLPTQTIASGPRSLLCSRRTRRTRRPPPPPRLPHILLTATASLLHHLATFYTICDDGVGLSAMAQIEVPRGDDDSPLQI